MIEPGTILFPEKYAHWLEEEYNDYTSICHPNDCIRAKSKEDMFKDFRNGEELCKEFKQRFLKS